MRALITGVQGQLGTALENVCRSRGYDVFAYGHEQLDITRPSAIKSAVERDRPAVIFNCAAYNAVEQAETEADRAFLLNAIAPYWLALEARALRARLFHVSSDYVFNGEKDGYTELDRPEPINVYGLTKLTGENMVRLAYPEAVIIRTSWLYGPARSAGSRNFVAAIVGQARRGEDVRVVDDQFGSPSFAPDVAETIVKIMEQGGSAGLYHVVNSGSCSRFEQAKEILRLLGSNVSLTRINTAESGTRIRRPRRTVLKSVRLSELGIAPLRSWQDALSSYLEVAG